MNTLRTLSDTLFGTPSGFATVVLAAGASLFMLMIVAAMRLRQDGKDAPFHPTSR